MTQIEVWRFAFGVVTTVLLLLLGHFFRWFRDLHRLWAYIYGVGTFAVGAAIWKFPDPELLMWAAFPVAGGSVVLLSWGYDWLRNLLVNEKADAIAKGDA